MADWKETWDWAEKVWGEEEGYGFNHFFGAVASIRAEAEDLEEVGSSDVWHLSFYAVIFARKQGATTRQGLIDAVLDYQEIYGVKKAVLVARHAA